MRLKDEKFYKTVRDFLDIYLIRHKGYSLNTQKSYRVGIKYKSPASPDKSRVCGAFSVSVALLWH